MFIKKQLYSTLNLYKNITLNIIIYITQIGNIN